MTDRLIEQLVNDLQPKKTLVDLKLWMHCTACLVMVSVAVLMFMGLRGDYLSAMQNGALFWKPGIFLMTWIGSLLLITDISRPNGWLRKKHTIPLIAAVTLLIWQFIVQSRQLFLTDMTHSLSDGSALYCLSVIMGGGAIAMMMAWKYWFSKTASRYPVLLGALAGLSAGSLAAAAYALHCDHDVALYVSVYYGAPVLALSILGGFLGKRLLRW
ncbi:MAG: NrsF family protein [Bdellovibrionales bacterium]